MAAILGSPREPAWPEPRVFTDWRLRALGVALLLVPFFVPVPVELRRHVLIATLGDRLHMVLLAGAALALYWRGPLRGRLPAAALAAAALGGAIELLQELVGRQALFHDFVLDVMGIAMVVGWILWRGHGRREGVALILAMLAVTAFQLRELPPVMIAADRAGARFPVLEDCRDPVGAALWGDDNGAVLTYVVESDGLSRRDFIRQEYSNLTDLRRCGPWRRSCISNAELRPNGPLGIPFRICSKFEVGK